MVRTYDRYSKAKKRSRALLDAVMDNGGAYDTKSRHYYIGYVKTRCNYRTYDMYVYSVSQSELKRRDFSNRREHGYITEHYWA